MIDRRANIFFEFVDAEYNMIPEPRSSKTTTPTIARMHSTRGIPLFDCNSLPVWFTLKSF
jgi:hypothetical protein